MALSLGNARDSESMEDEGNGFAWIGDDVVVTENVGDDRTEEELGLGGQEGIGDITFSEGVTFSDWVPLRNLSRRLKNLLMPLMFPSLGERPTARRRGAFAVALRCCPRYGCRSKRTYFSRD